MEYNKYYWLNEDSRTFLSRGYISESPEQRIKDIAIKAEKYLNIKGLGKNTLGNNGYKLCGTNC